MVCRSIQACRECAAHLPRAAACAMHLLLTARGLVQRSPGASARQFLCHNTGLGQPCHDQKFSIATKFLPSLAKLCCNIEPCRDIGPNEPHRDREDFIATQALQPAHRPCCDTGSSLSRTHAAVSVRLGPDAQYTHRAC